MHLCNRYKYFAGVPNMTFSEALSEIPRLQEVVVEAHEARLDPDYRVNLVDPSALVHLEANLTFDDLWRVDYHGHGMAKNFISPCFTYGFPGKTQLALKHEVFRSHQTNGIHRDLALLEWCWWNAFH